MSERAVRQDAEKVRSSQKLHDNHHSKQQYDGCKVDRLHRVIKAEKAAPDHSRRTSKGNSSAIGSQPGDSPESQPQVGCRENTDCQPEWNRFGVHHLLSTEIGAFHNGKDGRDRGVAPGLINNKIDCLFG